jgi:hypothetical protein
MWHVWGEKIQDFDEETRRNETNFEDLGMYGRVK